MTNIQFSQIKFKDFIILQRGFDLPEKNRIPGNIPIVASTSIAGYHNAYKVKAPVVTTGRSGALGEVLYVNCDCWPLNTALWVKDFKGNDPKFVYYFLKTLHLEQYNSGAGVPTLNRNHLDELDIFIPDLSNQIKIAQFLSSYDDLIENNNRRIQILEQTAQEIYKEWFVNFRFPGHETIKMIDSETDFGEIPEGWEIKSIMDINFFRFINESIPKFDGRKIYYATADIDGLNITGKGEEFDYTSKPSRAQKQPLQNSVWFARMENTYKVLGFTYINNFVAESIILSSGMVGFQSDYSIFPFLFFTINSPEFHRIKDLYCTGATQRALTNEGLSQIKIILPKLEYIENYGEVLRNHLNEIFSLQEQNKNLKTTRDLLLPRLISGEIDVSELEII